MADFVAGREGPLDDARLRPSRPLPLLRVPGSRATSTTSTWARRPTSTPTASSWSTASPASRSPSRGPRARPGPTAGTRSGSSGTVKDGLIQVFFDDMDHPAMTAHDRTFAHGRIGVGSFDDTGHVRRSCASAVGDSLQASDRITMTATPAGLRCTTRPGRAGDSFAAAPSSTLLQAAQWSASSLTSRSAW